MFGAEVVRDRLEKLAVPAHEFKLDRARVGALAVLVVADHRVRDRVRTTDALLRPFSLQLG